MNAVDGGGGAEHEEPNFVNFSGKFEGNFLISDAISGNGELLPKATAC